MQFIGLLMCTMGLLILPKKEAGALLIFAGLVLILLDRKKWEEQENEEIERRERHAALQVERQRARRNLEKQEQIAREEKRVLAKQRQAQLARERRKLNYWDKLEGVEFEVRFAELLRDNGWLAQETRASGDGGIDIIARDPRGQSVAFECKRWNKADKVGIDVVLKLKGASYRDFDRSIVVTTSGYTPQAMEYSKEHGVELWGRADLLSLINSAERDPIAQKEGGGWDSNHFGVGFGEFYDDD